MKMSKEEIDRLLQMLSLTQDQELDCDQCLNLIAEFAERKLAGKSYSAGARLVENHLSICGECREEFLALQGTLDQLIQEE